MKSPLLRPAPTDHSVSKVVGFLLIPLGAALTMPGIFLLLSSCHPPSHSGDLPAFVGLFAGTLLACLGLALCRRK